MRAQHARPARLRLCGLLMRLPGPCATGGGAPPCLVACANDFTGAFLQGFDSSCIRFIDRPCVDEFVRAGRDAGSKDASLVWFVNLSAAWGSGFLIFARLRSPLAKRGRCWLLTTPFASLFGCHALSLGAHVVLEALDRVAAGFLGCKVVAVSVARDQFKRGGHRADDPAARTAFSLLESRLSQSEARTSLLWDASSLDCIAQGLDTVEVRMQRHMDNARAIAEYLAAHPAIPRVDYPGTASAHVVVRSPRARLCTARVRRLISRCRGARGQVSLSAPLEPGIARLPGAGGPRTRVSALEGDGGCTVRLFAGT